jgi:hypothetical protein
MGNSHGKPKNKKIESRLDTRLSTNSDETKGSSSQASSLLPSQSSSCYLSGQETKAKRNTIKARRVSSIFENSPTLDGDQRRKPKRMLSPILSKKAKDTYEEEESIPSTIESSSALGTPITRESASFFSANEVADDVIQRAIQAAAEATGSVGEDDPWPGPSTLPVNKPKPSHSRTIINEDSLHSGDSLVKQLYYMAENAGERKKEVDR